MLAENLRLATHRLEARTVSGSRPMTYRYLPLATAIALTFGVTFDVALAGVFTIDDPEVVRGEQEIELNTAVQGGFPVNADPVRNSWELEYSVGLTKWWLISPEIIFDTPEGGDFQASIASVENIFHLGEVGGVLGIAWFTEIDAAIHHDETNAVTFGPILKLGDEKSSLTLNPYFEETFGRNHEEGIDFTYGWKAKTSLRGPLAIGLEGFGVIPDFAHAPGIDFQEHRLGPVLYYERELPGAHEGKTVAIEGGILFGLTEATPNVTGKVNASLSF